MNIAVLNGPNLNLLGVREPEVYGTITLTQIERRLRARASAMGHAIEPWFQSNVEGDIVSAIQGLRGAADGAIVNAAAYTHTSLAIRDALIAVAIPFVEVHLSNVFAREESRQKSLLADRAVGVIAGFGADSYVLGLEAIVAAIGRKALQS